MIIGTLAAIDLFLWSVIAGGAGTDRLELDFLAVGQGDSEMIRMPGNATLLIDAGPDSGVARQIDAVMPWGNRRIDVAVVSHAQRDHFGGLSELLKRYTIGAIVYNGQGNDTAGFRELLQRAKRSGVPIITLGTGSSIRYGDNKFDIVSAGGRDLNEGAIVAKFSGGGVSALFTGDIGKSTERRLASGGNIRADILKIAHHGSKLSSTQEFLRAVRPKIAIIEVGKNSYGHPTKEALDRIKAMGAQLFRTDNSGTVRLVVEQGTIREYARKNRIPENLTK